MDETIQIANSDLALRGCSTDDYLGVMEVREKIIYHTGYFLFCFSLALCFMPAKYRKTQ
jgi:hypothetical protein